MLYMVAPILVCSVVLLVLAVVSLRQHLKAPPNHPPGAGPSRYGVARVEQLQLMRMAAVRDTAREAVRNCTAILSTDEEDDEDDSTFRP